MAGSFPKGPRGIPGWWLAGAIAMAVVPGMACAQAGSEAPAVPATKAETVQPEAPPQKAAEVLPRLEDLPYADRRDLPPLKFSMFRWHEDPGQRFVVFKERRVAEDGVLGQELWLREIRADGVVLDFRGKRFFVAK